MKLAIAHSASCTKKSKTYICKNPEDAINIINQKLHSNYKKKDLLYISEPENSNKYLRTTIERDSIAVKIFDLESSDSIFSINNQIIARSKIKLLKTIESFLGENYIDICYANIDSIHISIPKSKFDYFSQRFSGMISEEMGDLKIQTTGDNAYWFDIGRYFFISNEKVTYHKNITFNSKSSSQVFQTTTYVPEYFKNPLISCVNKKKLHIQYSFSYKKHLLNYDTDEKIKDFTRFHIDEIYSYRHLKLTLLNEKRQTQYFKYKSYLDLKERYELI